MCNVAFTAYIAFDTIRHIFEEQIKWFCKVKKKGSSLNL